MALSKRKTLALVPGLLKKIINEDMWRERVIQQTGELARFTSFADFLTGAPLAGLGEDIRMVRHVCVDDPEALDALDRVLQRPPSVHPAVDNIHSTERPSGTSSTRALRRLRKDRPDLHAKVLDGSLSPHAAMIEAGFRIRTITVPLDPVRAAATLRRYFDLNELIHAWEER